MGTKERTELWKKALAMLEAVQVDRKNLKELEGFVNQITTDLEESINVGELPDLRPLYEQQSLATKLQSHLENLHSAVEELEQVKKELAKYAR